MQAHQEQINAWQQAVATKQDKLAAASPADQPAAQKKVDQANQGLDAAREAANKHAAKFNGPPPAPEAK